MSDLAWQMEGTRRREGEGSGSHPAAAENHFLFAGPTKPNPMPDLPENGDDKHKVLSDDNAG